MMTGVIVGSIRRGENVLEDNERGVGCLVYE